MLCESLCVAHMTYKVWNIQEIAKFKGKKSLKTENASIYSWIFLKNVKIIKNIKLIK